VLKVSALEIYNEVVKDLLASDSTPLRLLDDKEVMRLFSISLSKF
jgi:centromeric protein E